MSRNGEEPHSLQSKTRAVLESKEYLDYLTKETLTAKEARWLTKHTVENFTNFVNRGIVGYRKSVTEADDFAAAEFTGEGSTLIDVHGRRYIDCLGGYGLMSLGWNHPVVVEAVERQLKRSSQCSQELLDPLRGMLCRLLAHVTPGDIQYSFLSNSGAEAVDGAMKLARAYTGKTGFIAATRGFHGKTLGALSVMGKASLREKVPPLIGNVYHVPFGDANAVRQQLHTAQSIGQDIAAVIMEPIQGEAGAIVPPDDFWPMLRMICDEYNVLLIADEVQTGLGRTGTFWGVDHWNVVPDIITTGKALGGGIVPMSAFMSTPKIWDVFADPNPFFHSSTTGGNPLACAASIAALNVILTEDLPRQAKEKGDYLLKHLVPLTQEYNDIYTDQGITGRGLLLAQHFRDSETGYKVAAGLFRRGVLVSGTESSAHTIRIEPPLIISYEQMDEMLNRLKDTLVHARRNQQRANTKLHLTNSPMPIMAQAELKAVAS